MPWVRPTTVNRTVLATECSKPRKAKTKTAMIIEKILDQSSWMKPL